MFIPGRLPIHIFIIVVYEKQVNLLSMLCACPIVPEIYVGKRPKACLVNEEASLGKAPMVNGELGYQYGRHNASGWWLVV